MQHLATAQAVITGDEADEEASEEPASPFAQLDRPVVVYVCDLAGGCDGFDELEEVIFKNEKIGLAMKAFRAVRMTPEDAARDPILAEEGRDVPRLMLVDPAKEDVKVLEGSRLKVSTLYSTMRRVARHHYEENLDKVVKTHLKLLTDRDQLANEVKVLDDKAERYADDERKLERVREELAEVQAELEQLAEQERELWQLTPKSA